MVMTPVLTLRSLCGRQALLAADLQRHPVLPLLHVPVRPARRPVLRQDEQPLRQNGHRSKVSPMSSRNLSMP